MIRCVVFDFDGTLVRSNGIKRRSFYDATAHLPGAGQILDQLFNSDFRGDRYATFAELCRQLDMPPDTPAADPAASLVDAYGRSCHDGILSCDEVPGALQALTELQTRGIPAYLVSATPERDLKPVVSARGLDRFLQYVVGGPTNKSAHLTEILRREGIPPSDLAMVGDGIDDAEAARAVGCHFVAVMNSGNPRPARTEPAVDDLSTLLAILWELAAKPPCKSHGASIA